MATTVLGLKTFAASDPVDYNEINDNYNKIDNGVKTAMQGRAAHNLLDNSDFTNPVNQRGATTTSQYKYFLDRWISRLSDISLAVGNSGLTLTSSATANIFIYQKLSAGKALNGKTVTVAVCDGTGNVATTTTNLPTTNATSWTSYAVAQTNNGVYASVIDLGSGDYPIAVRVGVQSDALNKTIRWVALYEGSYTADTLPAYVPKEYAAELAECQMYLYDPIIGGSANSTYIGTGFKINDTTIYFTVPIPTMRKTINTPTLTAKNISIFENTGNVIVPSELYVLGKITAGVATICARTNSALSAGKVYTLFANADDSSLKFSNDL